MYNKIEELYKKKSSYNIIKVRLFIAYFITIGILLILNHFKLYTFMIIVAILMFIVMKIICEKELKTKLYINLDRKDKTGKPLGELINLKERYMFKEFLKKEATYNEKMLLCIIEHYRSLLKRNVVGGNLLAILSLVIPIISSFVDQKGFNMEKFVNAIPYLVIFSLFVIIIYFTYRKIIELKSFFKGEDGMVERLEEIFSEIYFELINEEEKIRLEHMKSNKIKNNEKRKRIKNKK
ncbi:MAG: hypothetical protein E7162_07220 [Firmicutes bacterium]|nr:hypothetical protein [Bacillota bacterium]